MSLRKPLNILLSALMSMGRRYASVLEGAWDIKGRWGPHVSESTSSLAYPYTSTLLLIAASDAHLPSSPMY
jgi:hypothetical protein